MGREALPLKRHTAADSIAEQYLFPSPYVLCRCGIMYDVMKPNDHSKCMSNCLPQNFLRNGATLKDLELCFGIKARRGMVDTNLVSLKYNQIESPMSSELVQQCRGLILDEDNNWEIVARPFDKFFNYGEALAPDLDWNSARVQEKVDGTCILMYYYQNKWRVGTLGSPDASGEVAAGMGFTFKDLFWWHWEIMGCKLPDSQWQPWTFIFELCTQFNRIVVNHAEPKLVFIAARGLDGEEEMVGGDEFPCKNYQWEAVKEYHLHSLTEILDTFQKLDPLQQEGYVVIDGNLRRLKVKHPGYVALHHLRGNGYRPRRILDVIRKGEVAEVIANFPEWRDDFTLMGLRYADLIAHLEVEYERLKDIPVQKAFALEALKTRLSGALFAVRSGKSHSIRDFVSQMNIDTLLITLEI